MNKKDYISLPLAKAFADAGCGIESEYWYYTCSHEEWGEGESVTVERGKIAVFTGQHVEGKDTCYPEHPVYSFYQILTDKRFWGEEPGLYIGERGMTSFFDKEDSRVTCGSTAWQRIKHAYHYHSEQLLAFLQQDKREEAEVYIKQHCVFLK